MAEFVNGLIKQDIHRLTDELEAFMESQTESIQEIHIRHLKNMTVRQLKQIIKGLPIGNHGRKAELIARLCKFKRGE